MPEKLEPVYTGDVKDSSLNTDTENEILSLKNGEIILKKIKNLIGEYRLEAKDRDTTPNVTLTKNHIDKISNKISDLLEDFDLIPPEIIAILDQESYNRHQEPFCNIRERLKFDLYNSKFLLCHTLGVLDNIKQSKGSKSKTLENKLLAKTALLLEKLGNLGVINAAGMASKILNINTEPLYTNRNNFPKNNADARRLVIKTINTYGLNSP